MSARDSLVRELRAIAGNELHIIGIEDSKDELEAGRPVVMVRQRRLRRLAEAPVGSLRIEFSLTITSDATDPTKAEPELDDLVPGILSELDELDWYGWSIAEKVLDGQHLAYEVECFVIAGPMNEGR